MQKKLLQLQPRILLSKCPRRPGQLALFFRDCVNVGCLLLTSQLPYLQIKLIVFSPVSLPPTPLSLSKRNRNNTKPKQESQFDFKPPPASQVRNSFKCVPLVLPAILAHGLQLIFQEEMCAMGALLLLPPVCLGNGGH